MLVSSISARCGTSPAGQPPAAALPDTPAASAHLLLCRRSFLMPFALFRRNAFREFYPKRSPPAVDPASRVRARTYRQEPSLGPSVDPAYIVRTGEPTRSLQSLRLLMPACQ